MPTGGTVNYADYLTTANVTDLYGGTYQDDPLGQVYTYTNAVAADRWKIDVPHLVSSQDLEDFAHRLFKIIEEHTPIDISEDEFMELIMDDR